MLDYKKRLVEVDEILKYLDEEELLKIPEEIRNSIKEKKDKEYCWKYDITKPLKEQNVSRDTIAFLSYLNMEYLLDEKQKELMIQIHKLNEKKERNKIQKYCTEDLFSKNKSQQQEVKKITNVQDIVEYKEDFFTRMINKIRNFLRI